MRVGPKSGDRRLPSDRLRKSLIYVSKVTDMVALCGRSTDEYVPHIRSIDRIDGIACAVRVVTTPTPH